MIRFIIPTFFGLGYINILPGTIGSLVAIPLAYYLLLTGGFFFLIMCGIGMFFLGWWSTNSYIGKSSKDTDPSEIIVDEVVGQWLSLLPFLFFSVAQKEIDYLLNDVGWLQITVHDIGHVQKLHGVSNLHAYAHDLHH